MWVDEFKDWYNVEHRHSGIRYVTPNERHEGRDKAVLEQRKQVYQTAQIKHPGRWSKAIRNWDFISRVELNPEVKLQAA